MHHTLPPQRHLVNGAFLAFILYPFAVGRLVTRVYALYPTSHANIHSMLKVRVYRVLPFTTVSLHPYKGLC